MHDANHVGHVDSIVTIHIGSIFFEVARLHTQDLVNHRLHVGLIYLTIAISISPQQTRKSITAGRFFCYNRRTVPALLKLVAETGTEKTLLTKTSLDESAEGCAAKLCTDGRNLKHEPSGRIRFLVVFAVVDIVAHEHGSG